MIESEVQPASVQLKKKAKLSCVIELATKNAVYHTSFSVLKYQHDTIIKQLQQCLPLYMLEQKHTSYEYPGHHHTLGFSIKKYYESRMKY